MLPLGVGGCSSCEMLPLVRGRGSWGGGGPVRCCPWWEGGTYEMLPLVGGWEGESWGGLGQGGGSVLCVHWLQVAQKALRSCQRPVGPGDLSCSGVHPD